MKIKNNGLASPQFSLIPHSILPPQFFWLQTKPEHFNFMPKDMGCGTVGPGKSTFSLGQYKLLWKGTGSSNPWFL